MSESFIGDYSWRLMESDNMRTGEGRSKKRSHYERPNIGFTSVLKLKM